MGLWPLGGWEAAGRLHRGRRRLLGGGRAPADRRRQLGGAAGRGGFGTADRRRGV